MIAIAQGPGGPDPLLLPDRAEAYQLRDVYEKCTGGCRSELVLDFGDSFLRLRAVADDDTIVAQFEGQRFAAKKGYRSIGSVASWQRYLNKSCGWTWSALNQQGYWDTIVISFDAVVPNVLLNVMASSIYVFTIGPMEKIAAGKPTRHKSGKDTAQRS